MKWHRIRDISDRTIFLCRAAIIAADDGRCVYILQPMGSLLQRTYACAIVSALAPSSLLFVCSADAISWAIVSVGVGCMMLLFTLQ